MKRLLFGFLFISLVSAVQAQSPISKLSDEEYRVYDAVINVMFAGDKVTFDTPTKIKTLVICDGTKRNDPESKQGENWSQVRIRFPSLSDETFADYLKKIDDQTTLARSFDLKLPYLLIAKKDCEDAGRRDDDAWSEFYKKYPDSAGSISFSRVGFNKTGTQALVYFEHWCRDLCGTGHYLLLSKGEKGWQVIGRGEMWISLTRNPRASANVSLRTH